jgi:hypothetical protein
VVVIERSLVNNCIAATAAQQQVVTTSGATMNTTQQVGLHLVIGSLSSSVDICSVLFHLHNAHMTSNPVFAVTWTIAVLQAGVASVTVTSVWTSVACCLAALFLTLQ